MKFNPLPLVRLVGSRSFAIVLVLASVAVTLLGYFPAGEEVTPIVGSEFGLPLPSQWFGGPVTSLIAGLAADFLVMAGIVSLVRIFNLIRGLRGGGTLCAALYMLMEGARPAAGAFTSANLLVLVILMSTFLLYSAYLCPERTRRLLLVFVLVGTGTLFYYGFIPYLLVMAIGCFQMRVMSLRTIIAMIAGTLVPYWVLYAFGVIDFHDFMMPDLINLLLPGPLSSVLQITAATLVAVVVGVATGFLDVLQVYARNARTRAFFGLFAVTGIVTVILCVVDFTHIDFYVPLLNLIAAYFVTLLYSFRQRHSLGAGTVAIVILTLSFAVLYIWKLIAPYM